MVKKADFYRTETKESVYDNVGSKGPAYSPISDPQLGGGERIESVEEGSYSRDKKVSTGPRRGGPKGRGTEQQRIPLGRGQKGSHVRSQRQGPEYVQEKVATKTYKIFDAEGYWNAVAKEHEQKRDALNDDAQKAQQQADDIKAQIELNDRMDRQNVLGSAQEEQREQSTLLGTVEPAMRGGGGGYASGQTTSGAMRTDTAKALKDRKARQGGQKNSERSKRMLTGKETTKRNKQSNGPT